MAHSVIFINSPERHVKSGGGGVQAVKQLFYVTPYELMFRIFASFVPPFGVKYRKVYVDMLGPVLALLILTAFVHYGYTLKNINVGFSPTESMCVFITLMPAVCFLLCKLGRSCITLCEMVSLIGYALYGHLFALMVSFLCFQEQSNTFFFVCLLFFSGLSTLRLTLVILVTIPTPPARLLICTLTSTTNILFLVFLHFVFMHKTFNYGSAELSRRI